MTHTTDQSAEAARAAHEKLMRDLQQLEDGVRAESGIAELAAGLSRVQGDVAAHFESEEQGGYMSDVIDRAPQVNARVQKLLAEHTRLLRSLEQLIAASRAGSAGTIAPLRQRTAHWIAAVREHEAAENRLVQKVYSRDECAED